MDHLCKWCDGQFHSYRCDLLDFREADRIVNHKIMRTTRMTYFENAEDEAARERAQRRVSNIDSFVIIEEAVRPIRRVTMMERIERGARQHWISLTNREGWHRDVTLTIDGQHARHFNRQDAIEFFEAGLKMLKQGDA